MITKCGYKSFCIIRFGPLSEILYTYPLAVTLKNNLTDSRIIWITDEDGMQILKGSPYIDKLIFWQRHLWIKDFPYPHRTPVVIWEILSIVHYLKQLNIEVIIDLEGTRVSRWLAKQINHNSYIDYKRSYCAKGSKGDIQNQSNNPSSHPDDMHYTEKYAPILQNIGINEWQKDFEIPLPKQEEERAEGFFADKITDPDRPILGIYADAEYENRRWQSERFATLIDLLTENLNLNCLLLWLGWEPDIARTIEKRLSSRLLKAYPSNAKSIIALLKRCRLLIAGDSSLIQMANIVKVPVLGLFGPTSPKNKGPTGENDRVIQGRAKCSPCNMPYCKRPICMEDIEIEEVYNTVTEMLKDS